MKITFRCSCQHNPILGEYSEGVIIQRRRGYFMAAKAPGLVKCGNCGLWYRIEKNGDWSEIPKEDAELEIRGICSSCGAAYNVDEDIICRNCFNHLPSIEPTS